jgi:DNA mismatch repair protein MutL
MSDIIRLLPDNIANQIAAGEVIQRPASCVKELLENSIDSGATAVKLIVKDAGKTSIQVIDDGKGMSETDARMAFERHATSKIKDANDLFNIKTMGFRGEALASIAAIAHVELITCKPESEVGTRLLIEGTSVVKQEPAQCMPGSSITVKNLFYNVPARRKFLKSDPVEMRHILDEFHRVALANPDIFFTLHHNGSEVYHLPKTNLKQRIIGIIGKQINDKLVPVSEDAEIVRISGFVGKPESGRKTAGDQFVFVNNRFIKSNYLNHAIRAAYEDLIAKDIFPSYFLYLDVDPSTIDINVHPTKTEIKFEDERMIYNYLKVSIKHALGQYSLSPMLDFEAPKNNFGRLYSDESRFGDTSNTGTFSAPSSPGFQKDKKSIAGWEELYQGLKTIEQPSHPDGATIEKEAWHSVMDDTQHASGNIKAPLQLIQSYIVYNIKSGIIVVDQHAAHERILYEHYLERLENSEVLTQKELFPITIELPPAKADVLKNILPRINSLGFEMQDFGHNTFILHGTPVGLDKSVSIETLIDQLIEQYIGNIELQLGIEDNLARSMASSASIKRGKRLEVDEMITLIDQLFGCKMSSISPSGQKIFITIDVDELQKRFGH